MSIQNPLVVDFSLLATEGNRPLQMAFDVQNANSELEFQLSNGIRPVIQANTYIHIQNQASTRWEIHHNLKKYPSVTVVDSAGTVVIGGVQYIDENYIICTFSHPFSGTAYLN